MARMQNKHVITYSITLAEKLAKRFRNVSFANLPYYMLKKIKEHCVCIFLTMPGFG